MSTQDDDRLRDRIGKMLGNTGAAALPMALSMGLEQDPPAAGTKLALLGIGSGLNSVMLGVTCE